MRDVHRRWAVEGWCENYADIESLSRLERMLRVNRKGS